MSRTASCTIDLDTDGKSSGYIQIGDSTNSSGWANHCVPITSIRNGAGPRLLLLAGNHGDEYEGQIVATDLSRRLQPSEIRGQVIIIPCLSQEASQNGNRLWNNGANFNRIFPGNEDGTINEKLAFFLSNDLFPICDVIVDMHSGGRSMAFIPSSNMVWVSDLSLRKVMLANMLAWNTEYHMIGGEQPSTNPYSLLPGDVVRQGKSLSTGEFGGCGWTTAETMKVIRDGLHDFMRALGVLNGEYKTRAERGLPDAKILDFREGDAFVTAPCEGIYENCVNLEDEVKVGDLVGKVHDFNHPDRQPVPVYAGRSGVISVVRGYPPVKTGDVVATIGILRKSIAEFEAAGS